jgi:hypothetical protein
VNHSTRIWLPLVLLPVLACGSDTKASTGRSEQETDSVIAQSQVPGAPVVKKAMDAQDTARAQNAARDSATAE